MATKVAAAVTCWPCISTPEIGLVIRPKAIGTMLTAISITTTPPTAGVMISRS